MADTDRLYALGQTLGLSPNQIGVPFLLIGDTALVGSDQVQNQLPDLIKSHLAAGGVAFPTYPELADLLPVPAPPAVGIPFLPENLPELATEPAPAAEPAVIAESATAVHDGFALAIVILLGMTAAMIYTAVRFWQARQGKPLPVAPGWFMTGLPLLALVGLGVAGYLAYIETQPVIPICGPVGDCQAVQQSEYAYLFGIPIGVIGVVGYLAILAAWLWGAVKNDNRAFLLLLGMTGAGVLFSIYLTYLEPFVIGAVCAWCLSSAVIVTLLMLMSLGLIQDEPALRGENS